VNQGQSISVENSKVANLTSWQGVVDRRSGLSQAQFVAEYRNPRKPVILTDATRDWQIFGRGTPGFFRDNYGNHKASVFGTSYRLSDLLDMLEASTTERPAPYPCKFEISTDFAELLPRISPRFAYSLPDRQSHTLVPRFLFHHVNNLEIFFGGPGGQFPYLHYDVLRLHAWITQLHGDKEFTLYSPGQERLLYVNPEIPWQSSIKNHHNPDFGRYPLFREARSQTVVLRAGETLFLPCGWWHTARSLNVTISVAFDQLCRDNWPAFVSDVVSGFHRRGKQRKAQLIRSYLRLLNPLFGVAEHLGANQHTEWGSR